VIIDCVLGNPDRDYRRQGRFCLGEISQAAMLIAAERQMGAEGKALT
jgi:hypothetical protein